MQFDRRDFLKTMLATTAAAGLPGSIHAGSKTEKPNIIVILADDLGYGDIGCNGATAVKTPNIDRLAAEGLNFTRGYCSASTCTPTRYSLLTGQYAFRQRNTGIAAPQATALIEPGTVTLPSLLKQAGYATAVIGKWHLGLGNPPAPDWNGEIKPGPLEIGFDHCLLLPTTNDRVPSVYVDDHKVRNLDPADPLWVGNTNPDNQPTGITHRDTLKMDWSHGHNQTIHNGIGRIGFFSGGHSARWRDEDLADAWVTESVKWMESNSDKPFFLYFASHDIHAPRMPHERFQGKTSLGFRGDAIVELDWCVGQLMDTLDRLKIADNTLIVFSSDNGPVLDDGYKDQAVEKCGDHKPAGVYRAGKYSLYEGGTRVPFITHWPARIKPGISNELVCTIDLPTSMAALTGVPLADDACVDSFNVLPALLGAEGARGRDHLVQQNNREPGAIQADGWKLVQNKELYNLNEDPGETQNLIRKYPERAGELEQRLKNIIAKGRSRP